MRTLVTREDQIHVNESIPVIRDKLLDYLKKKDANVLSNSGDIIKAKMGAGWLIRLFGVFLVPEKYYPVLIEVIMESINDKTALTLKFKDDLGIGFRITNRFDIYFQKLSRELISELR